jgi:hypothetical protein
MCFGNRVVRTWDMHVIPNVVEFHFRSVNSGAKDEMDTANFVFNSSVE